ncbi:MAG: extracellular matrix/biofilm biosynthesis regulator RemA family protein [Candidatus Omnitrophota bacterium]
MGLVVQIGFNNIVMRDRIVAVVASEAAPVKRLREEARRNRKLIDATHGRRTRSIIITDSDHVILSSAQPETLAQRIAEKL